MLRNIHRTLERADVQAYLGQLVAKVQSHPRIDVYLSATLASISGHVGNFKSVLNAAGHEKPISHGVVIIATGGGERTTELYLHGKNPHVTTQRKLRGDSGRWPAARAGNQGRSHRGHDPVRREPQ